MKFKRVAVPFEKFESHMEYTIENGTMTVRALGYADSMRFVANYKFERSVSGKQKAYILTCYLNETIHEECNPNIEYTKWGGIRINIRLDREFEKGVMFFYKDEKGEHEITKGTKESWKKYILEKIKNRPLYGDPKDFEEALTGI